MIRTEKIVRRIVVASVAAASFGLIGVPALASSSGPSDFGAIDSYVKSQMDDAHLPGIALGLVHGDQIVHLKGFGRADAAGDPVTPNTPFIIGSVSKSFTALAVMQLVEAGRVSLDTPVRTYVSDFRLNDTSDSSRITVRQLLNQTSGIPTDAGIAPLSGPVTSLDAQVRSLSQVKLQSEPGARYAYSNANYEVLGTLVEDVSGLSFGDYLSRYVFDPLGMSHSFTSSGVARSDGLAGGCQLWFGLPQCLPSGTGFRPDFVPAGFVISSVADMSRYLVAQLNGGSEGSTSVLSPASVALMHAPAAYAGLSAQGGSYGMGWFAGPRVGIDHTVWHDGSAGASHSMVLMLPDSGWGIVILTNGESLLYSMLGRIDIIADGVAARLVHSREPGTLSGLYIAFDAVVILIAGLQLRTIIRLVRRPTSVRQHKGRVRSVVFGIVLPVWRHGWVPIAILFGLPALLSAPWNNLINTDVGAWLFVVALLLLLTGAARLYRWSATRRPAVVPTNSREREQYKQAS